MSQLKDHYFLLSNISQQLSKRNVQELVYSCSNVLKKSVAEQITSGRELFRELERLAYLGHSNYDFLQERLVLIGRSDLASMLPHEIEIILGDALSQPSQFGGISTHVTQECHNADLLLVSITEDKKTWSMKVAYRRMLLQISDELTSKDIHRLKYVCSLPDRLHDPKEDVRAIELFQFLEKQELISPGNIDFLADCLEEVGRRDLVNYLVSLSKPQALLNCLRTSYQHLAIKFHMLRAKKATYGTQMKMLRALSKCNPATMVKLCNTFATSLYTSYSYETVYPIAKSLSTDLLRSFTKFASMVESTLACTFELDESYLTCLKLVHDGCTDFKQLTENVKKCHSCFQEFSKVVSELQWNTDMCCKVQSEIDNRRTPIGTPANVACNTIYDIAKELYGGDAIQQEREALDKELHILESGHYNFCYRILMYQWLLTLLCLAIENEDSAPSLNLSEHRDTLLKITEAHKDRIQVVLPIISHFIGFNLCEELATHLKDAGIQFDVCTMDKQLEPLKDLNLFERVSIPFYTFLVQFLAVAFMGPKSFCLKEVNTKLLQYHFGILSSKPYVNSAIQITANAGAAFHDRVERFVQKTVEIDQSCAPLIKQLTNL